MWSNNNLNVLLDLYAPICSLDLKQQPQEMTLVGPLRLIVLRDKVLTDAN